MEAKDQHEHVKHIGPHWGLETMRFIFDPRTSEYYAGSCDVGEFLIDMNFVVGALLKIDCFQQLKNSQTDLAEQTFWHSGPRYFKRRDDLPEWLTERLDELWGEDKLYLVLGEDISAEWMNDYQKTDTGVMYVDEAGINFRAYNGDKEVCSVEITKEDLEDMKQTFHTGEYAEWMLARHICGEDRKKGVSADVRQV